MKRADLEVSYEYGEYVVDNNKQLYLNKDGEYEIIEKLRKNVFRMTGCNGRTYLMDTFGDCFFIDGSHCTFIFGILGLPHSFDVAKHRILAMDSYGRLWVYHTDGTLLTVCFFSGQVLNVKVTEQYMAVATERDSKTESGPEHSAGSQRGILTVYDKNMEKILEAEYDEIVEYRLDEVVISLNNSLTVLSV